ncbi:DUF1799 domain-containing protein [Caenispirillum bisanense]|uniref:DUF1799 domain-containing protein n=1 Tax=Caenispirillum bisanense TaxID=414052 RepID=A0A286GYT9_9PROT|nr:DUF1799 domain-containing protein [Caenispirillum bisanense]SOE00683.1 Phage related hypothetical protein [Caenispirillum bisanense]
MVDELAEWGAPPELVEEESAAAERAAATDHVATWPENWPALRIFLASATQWRVAHGGRSGLDYPAVEWVAKRHGIEIDADCLDRLQVLETTALEVWADQRERAAEKAKRERNR